MTRKTSKNSKGRAKAKRQTKRHQAVHAALRLKVLVGPFVRLWAVAASRLPKVVRIPGTDTDVDTQHAISFIVVLGLAIGGGYWGAQSLFGSQHQPQVGQSYIIQQNLNDVILPEPNGNAVHGARAYEEKVADAVYEPPHDIPAPQKAKDPQVASLPPAHEDLGEQPLWMNNAIAYTQPPAGAPIIAIVIDDMGVDRKRSRHMWEDVPGPLTLSFMTYAGDLPLQTKAARARGHELMLHMSMEPSNATIDAGPNVLMTSMGDRELNNLVEWGLDRFDGYVGVNNHMGSRFTEDAHAMGLVLERIRQRGLLFLDSRTSPHSVGSRVARSLGMAALDRNVFLDNDNDVGHVLKQLNELERLARKRGVAIGIGHPRDATIEVLKTWIPEAIDRGLAIVPLSGVMKHRIAEQAAKVPG